MSVGFSETSFGSVPLEWKPEPFERCIRTGKINVGKVNASEYEQARRFPVVDQGNNVIAGYSSHEDAVYTGTLPVIVFGDHTRIP